MLAQSTGLLLAPHVELDDAVYLVAGTFLIAFAAALFPARAGTARSPAHWQAAQEGAAWRADTTMRGKIRPSERSRMTILKRPLGKP
ncbi:MAG TPA: hypothetical protein VMU22_01555 [Rhizomicrobium sp.]|nr:hypothetical protein [Rhizomicrobium sp.]